MAPSGSGIRPPARPTRSSHSASRCTPCSSNAQATHHGSVPRAAQPSPLDCAPESSPSTCTATCSTARRNRACEGVPGTASGELVWLVWLVRDRGRAARCERGNGGAELAATLDAKGERYGRQPLLRVHGRVAGAAGQQTSAG